MLEHCLAHFCFLEYLNKIIGQEQILQGIFVAQIIPLCTSGADALQPL
jgi:hypothetical protein